MFSHKVIAIKSVVVVVVVFVLVSGDVEVRCKEREREALLSFKEGLIDVRGALSGWGGDECCKWIGVMCSNTTGHVIGLRLGGGEFGGKVGSSLLELHHLNNLDLSYNDFGGDRIPEFIGSMKQLQGLRMSYSNFSGTVPPVLGNLTNLRALDLSYNYLRSQNLDWLSSLSSLAYLDLSYSLDLSTDTNWLQHMLSLHSLQILLLQYCNLNDVKPSAALLLNSSSTSLSILGLSNNHLTSSTFDWLCNMSTTLMRVSLSHNALGGQIPNSFERLILLEYLDLSFNMLEGEITKSLGNLSHLKVLYLYRNELRGDLDELFGNVSAKGTIWASLEMLDLGHNQFSGSVPDLRAFPALTEVYLGRNNFTGPVPLSLGQLSNLHVLDVSRNFLEGTVSESHLTKLDNLKVLDLSLNSLSLLIAPDWNPPFQLDTIILAGCKMGPGFPKWIQTQRNVSKVELSSAGIFDLPKWLWSFSPSLEFLILSDNHITSIPADLSSTSILNIDLTSNKISGPIPLFQPNTQSLQLSQNMLYGSISSICKMHHDSLFSLDLSDNQFSGEIPDCWENMPSLFFLNLANNSFSGEIPHSLGSLQKLATLLLRDNNLSGELPSTLRFCQKLSAIDFGGNELSGYIPAWIGYTGMKYVNFRSNRFYGSISPDICNLAYLQVLDLSRNNLSGNIPNCFNNFISLAQTNAAFYFVGFRYLFRYNPWLSHLSYVKDYSQSSKLKWKGRDTEYLGNLILLKLIDFSSNRLTGNIPESFSSMRGLISLNLSRNSLTGNIIPDIGQMERLESLDLSDNQLSGQIPRSLEELHFISILDLSNNNLSGKIPSSTQLQGFDISSYAGNNGLCGLPLALCPEDSLIRPPNTTQVEEDDGFWRLSFMQGFVIFMAFGFILGFWGVVGSLVLKKSWRYAYFNFLDDAGDWLYATTTIFLSKWR